MSLVVSHLLVVLLSIYALLRFKCLKPALALCPRISLLSLLASTRSNKTIKPIGQPALARRA